MLKKELFRSYCSSLYCCSLWSDYRKATYRKLTVAFNNIHRRMLGLPWRCSASAMYANYDLLNIDTVIRRQWRIQGGGPGGLPPPRNA